MSTYNKIDPISAQVEISRIRASAITLSCGPRVQSELSMDQLYELATEQETTIVTDVPMADRKHAGLSSKNDRVLVSYTGQDTARSAWARLLTPQPEEIKKHPGLRDTKDRVERLVREVNFQLMHEDMIHTQVFFGRNEEFMGRVNFLVPRKYAKLAYDMNLNFVRPSKDNIKRYKKSKGLDIPDLWLVCHPDWVNPNWNAWRNRVHPSDNKRLMKDPEPKRIMMVFDTVHKTAYLLGARYFGESKKACLTMIWDAAIKSGLGMPIHGSSKTLFLYRHVTESSEAPGFQLIQSMDDISIAESNQSLDAAKSKSFDAVESKTKKKSKAKTTRKSKAKSAVKSKTKSTRKLKTIEKSEESVVEKAQPSCPLKATSFITIGLSGSGKSTIGNDSHEDYLFDEVGEHVRLGNDDALVILYEPDNREAGTVGLENGCYNKSNDYTPESAYTKTVQSAENVMVSRQGKELQIIHQDILNGNGRVQTARHLLKGADAELDTPHPDFISLLMKDETLPPLMRIDDPQLMVSMYMCLASRSTSAENIPVDQMGKLRMIAGANPFNTWGMQFEAESLEKMLQYIGCRGIILNTGGFFIDGESNQQSIMHKIPKELSLSIYPLLARDLIRWVNWPQFPGAQIPAPGTFEHLFPGYDKKFNPIGVEDMNSYSELLRDRLLERLEFLLTIKIDRRFILPIRKAILQVDDYELRTRGPLSRVDNIDTLLDTGRDASSLN